MATIQNPRLFATKLPGGGNQWELTVKYTAVFSTFEVSGGNFSFRDGFQVWEEDSGLTGADDQLTGVVGIRVFNPGQTSVQRELKARVDGDTLDADTFGAEELYAKVRLRNLDLNVLTVRRTPITSISA